jgi:hypothetical protein
LERLAFGHADSGRKVGAFGGVLEGIPLYL